MSEQQHQHHHHHHHDNSFFEDDADRMNRHNLNAIKYRKLAAKWGFRLLLLVAAIIGIATVVVYTLR